MAAAEVFIDTSGFYALLVKEDAAHSRAVAWLQEASRQRQRAVTTDYVLDETATLLKARGYARLIPDFFIHLNSSRSLTVEWITPQRFGEARSFFELHGDHDYSFTDCVSFVMMREHVLSEALMKDSHFAEAGFVALLVGV